MRLGLRVFDLAGCMLVGDEWHTCSQTAAVVAAGAGRGQSRHIGRILNAPAFRYAGEVRIDCVRVLGQTDPLSAWPWEGGCQFLTDTCDTQNATVHWLCARVCPDKTFVSP